MRATTREQVRAGAPARSSPPETVRVAPREIKDVAYRALRVAGVSAGEASLAARAVVAAHLAPGAGGDGLAMLLEELRRTTAARVGARFLAEGVPVLLDEAGRGLFFAVPAGVEHLLSHPTATAVLLPGSRWRPGADALVAVAAGDQAAGLCLEDVDAPEGPALLLRRCEAASEPPSSTAASAESTGVEVDAERWAAALAAARPYLVPEA